MLVIRHITYRRVLVLIIFVLLYNFIYIFVTKSGRLPTPPDAREQLGNQTTSIVFHFKSLHAGRISTIESESRMQSENTSGLPKIEKQKDIGLCINFNYNPDTDATALTSLLQYYTLIYQYIAILTPLPFVRLSSANQAILQNYGAMAFGALKPDSNGHTRINASEKLTGSLFHLGCTGTHRGYYQYLCISLCSQLFQHVANSRADTQLRGVLYLPDDVFFNLTLTLTKPQDYNLDEFWISSPTGFIDARNGTRKPTAWYWWQHNNNFKRFEQVFFKDKAFYDVLSTLYGANFSLVAGLADILYIPMADKQMSTLVDVIDKMMSIFPGVFGELIFPVLIDVAGALCGHWPYQHDRVYFNSTANQLNNLTNMRNLEKQHKVIRARNPFNTSEYMLRPCLLNFRGAFWDSERSSEILYRQAIFHSRAALNNTAPTERIEYVHPMKLSTSTSWQHRLWREAMDLQIRKLHQYQLNYSS